MGWWYSDKSNVKKPSLDSSKDKTNASNIKLKKLGITASGNAEEGLYLKHLNYLFFTLKEYFLFYLPYSSNKKNFLELC